MSLLYKWLADAGIKLKADSRYFHGGRCANKAREKLKQRLPCNRNR